MLNAIICIYTIFFIIRAMSKTTWLVEFAPKFVVDFIDLIEQNRKNSGLFRGFLRMKIDESYSKVGMQKCQVIFDIALLQIIDRLIKLV